TVILRELLFVPEANFALLQKATGLESDHAKFHIKRLVELEYVNKNGSSYSLSIRGKEYANKLDTDDNTIERQPKVAVIIAIKKGRKYLFQQRRKNPYYGFWGLPTGKVRWGEQICETATREAKEETGLDVEFEVLGIYHELVQVDGTAEYTEDKIFFVCCSTKVSGQLMEDFEGGHNEWATTKDVIENRIFFTLAPG
ncbi:MAG: NUDIX domain-containing protein, partial [Candidatus Nomurabacteria bacterium]|nr:NUDIX domain-containing protein [Candidatus Nomurabacteria bacterium]